MPYIKLAWSDKSATSSCVLNCFSFVWWLILAGRSAQTYEKWSIFYIFISFGLFPQVFGQVNKWLISELHELIRVVQLVAFTIVFFCFMIEIGREECSKLWKTIIFLVLLTPKLLGSLVAYIRFSWNYKSATCSCVSSCFYLFIFFIVRNGREVCSKLWNMIIFLYFYQFWSFSPSFWAG